MGALSRVWAQRRRCQVVDRRWTESLDLLAMATSTPLLTATTAKPIRFRSPDFPGWGAPDWADYFVDLPAGIPVTITGTEQHGANPWTRYAIVDGDGNRTNGVDPANLILDPS